MSDILTLECTTNFKKEKNDDCVAPHSGVDLQRGVAARRREADSAYIRCVAFH